MVTQHVHARFSQVIPSSWFPKMSVYHTLFSILTFPVKYCTELSWWEVLFWSLNELQHQCVLLHFCRHLLFMFDFDSSLGWPRVWWTGINMDMIARSEGSQCVQMPSISIEISDSQHLTRMGSMFLHYMPQDIIQNANLILGQQWMTV